MGMRSWIGCKSTNVSQEPSNRNQRSQNKRSIGDISHPKHHSKRSKCESMCHDCSRHFLLPIRLEHKHLVISATIIFLQIERKAVKMWHLPSIQQCDQSYIQLFLKTTTVLFRDRPFLHLPNPDQHPLHQPNNQLPVMKKRVFFNDALFLHMFIISKF
jgi:hypothetical protein